MQRGLIKFDDLNRPICPYCGIGYDRLSSHVRQRHHIDARTFKERFGLDVKKGICSPESAERTRVKTLEHADRVIAQNLLKAGAKTRFKIGSKGRTKDQVSLETKEMLKARLRSPKMIEAMQKSGQKVGKSGLGNQKRWKKADENITRDSQLN